MKKYIIALPLLFMMSCIHAKYIWSADACEVNLIGRCKNFCKTNNSKVDEFVKTDQYYRCSCVKDMEATFKNVCE